jgi:hypothetical protein
MRDSHESLDDIPPTEFEDEHYRLNSKTDNNEIVATT